MTKTKVVDNFPLRRNLRVGHLEDVPASAFMCISVSYNLDNPHILFLSYDKNKNCGYLSL